MYDIPAKILVRTSELHERALRIVYNNDNVSFQELPDKGGTVKMHERN